jgi:hypothetical protein
VLVNGRPLIAPSVLKNGDVIEVAGVKLSFYIHAQATIASP